MCAKLYSHTKLRELFFLYLFCISLGQRSDYKLTRVTKSYKLQSNAALVSFYRLSRSKYI